MVRATTKIRGRVCSPSGRCLGERTPPYGILHTAMVLNRRKDVIGQAVRNSERFAKQKDKQQGRATAMHSKESEKSLSAARSQVHLKGHTFAGSECLKIRVLVRTIHVVSIL